MALSHNVLIRALNSIILQAPHITPDNAPDFIHYALCWAEVLDAHHEMEETGLFPAMSGLRARRGLWMGMWRSIVSSFIILLFHYR